MAKVICPEHGEVEKILLSGHSIGHFTSEHGPNEQDLKGITFTFKVAELTEDSLYRLTLTDADGEEDYLAEFDDDWREEVTQAAGRKPEYNCGKEGCNKLLRFTAE